MPVGGKTKVAGVMGWPVAHSLSPRLHGFWLAEHGIDGVFVPLPVKPENFADALRALPKLGFVGASVTLPHKEAALALADEVDPVARRIGAVNTLIVRPDGGVLGRNTDAFGFMESLRESAPRWRADAGAAVVLGAGGAARAVVAALLEAGVSEIRVVNRTVERARELARAMAPATKGAVVARPWAERAAALAGAALVVNTTSLGMQGQPPLDLDLAPLPATATVADIVYAPLETPLLKAARARGLAGVDGLGMLLHQGRPAFAAWFGIEPQVTPALRAAVLADRAG